jgi:hypothetical protein
MAQAVDAERWDTMRDLRSGAPPSLARLAVIAGLHVSTVREQPSRRNWPKPEFKQAEVFWAAGDAAGAIAEAALAMAVAAGANMARLRTLIMMGTVGAVGEGASLAGPDLEAALAAPAEEGEGGGPGDNLAHIAGLLSRQTGLILRAAEASGGILSKGQVDTLTALIRLAEKFEALGSARAAEMQNKSDDERAELHRIVDERIFELAHELARRMVAAEAAGTGTGDAAGGLVPVGAA